MKKNFFLFRKISTKQPGVPDSAPGRLGYFGPVLLGFALAGIGIAGFQIYNLLQQDKLQQEALANRPTAVEEHLSEIPQEDRERLIKALENPDGGIPEANQVNPEASTATLPESPESFESGAATTDVAGAISPDQPASVYTPTQVEYRLERSARYWREYLADYSSLRTEAVRNPDSEVNREAINAIVRARNSRLSDDS